MESVVATPDRVVYRVKEVIDLLGCPVFHPQNTGVASPPFPVVLRLPVFLIIDAFPPPA